MGGTPFRLRALRRAIFLIVALALATGVPPADADAHSPGTTPEFFGINGAYLRDFTAANKAASLEGLASSMEAQGIDWARLTFDQAIEERTRGQFNWYVTDTMVKALARHGVRGKASFVGTAYWAADPAVVATCGVRAWPYDIAGWSDWVAAAANRYGPSGTFWTANPSVPKLPIQTWEIGNEVNMSNFWCPGVNPEQYAAVYSASAEAIEQVDPQAEVIVAGLAPVFGWNDRTHLDVPTFLSQLTAADPSLRESIPSVAIHPYSATPEGARDVVAKFRRAMRTAGMADTPMLANEIGWYTQGAAGELRTTEQERADRIATVSNEFWRLDCGVEGLAPYSWITLQQDPNNSEHWFGLTNATTGAPNAGGLAYGEQIHLALGEATDAPPQGTVRVCGPKTLTVQKTGSGTVSSSQAGIDCGTSCSASLEDDSAATLTAAAAPGYAFRGWSGCASVNGTQCTVAMSADRSVSANFVAQRALSVERSGSGSVASSPAGISCGASCGVTLDHGSTVILYPSATPGYSFRGWSGCDSVGSSNQCTIAMGADRTVSANFSGPRTLTVQKSGTGTITSSPAGIDCGSSCGTTVPDGTTLTLTPTAASGYAFRGWSGCDSVSGNRCTVLMNAGRTVSASFVAQRTLTVQKDGPGSVASVPAGIDCGPACSTVVDDGTRLRLVANPARGYRFAGWSGCPAPSGVECALTLGGDIKVTPSFHPVDPPDTLISKAKLSPRSPRAIFTFGGDGGTGALHYSCRLDSRRFRPCSSSASYRVTRGRHTFQVIAEDELGRADPTAATKTFSVKRRAER
jgi:hypothetical protein